MQRPKVRVTPKVLSRKRTKSPVVLVVAKLPGADQLHGTPLLQAGRA